MKTLETLFSKLSAKAAKRFGWMLAAIAFAGFLDSVYLTFKHYTGGALPCAIFTGCETVTTSRFATIGPVPIALLGAAYYLIVLILAVGYLENPNVRTLTAAALLTPIGFLTSLFLLYLQLFIIHAICFYCVISLTTSTLLFLISAGHIIQLLRHS